MMAFQQKEPKIFKTPKGTELPLIDLKGKNYLQVPHRIVWFREEKPDWVMEVSYPILTEQKAMARAEIRDETGKLRAVAHKVEDQKGFYDFIEKAETGAIGRALGMLGYGTQFAPEFDEGEERLADAPTSPVKKPDFSPPPAKKEIKNMAPQSQAEVPGKLDFKGANELKALGFSNGWSVDQMTESIKQITGSVKWSDVENKHLPVLKGLFGKQKGG